MTRVLPRHTAAAAAIAAVALLGATACGSSSGGSKPSTSAVANKLKSESDLSSATPAQLNCIADVLRKYVAASDLQKYVDGKESLDDVPDPKNKDQAEKETEACANAK